jgi:hypothetical protein
MYHEYRDQGYPPDDNKEEPGFAGFPARFLDHVFDEQQFLLDLFRFHDCFLPKNCFTKYFALQSKIYAGPAALSIKIFIFLTAVKAGAFRREKIVKIDDENRKSSLFLILFKPPH